MKILVFTEGTITMHKSALGHTRKEIIKQAINKEVPIKNFKDYIPIGKAVEKLGSWKKQGAEIIYLTSRRKSSEIKNVQNTLNKFKFPRGKLFFRKEKEEYKDVAERIMPDILIEDDCESIGGEKEMTITYIKPKIKNKIKSIVVKEFGGIDHLQDSLKNLIKA